MISGSCALEKMPKVGVPRHCPRRSNPRRISGAKTTGMAISRAGNALSTSQENAGSSIMVVSSARMINRTSRPRRRVTACVSRKVIKMAKKIIETRKRSRTLSQVKRWKRKEKLIDQVLDHETLYRPEDPIDAQLLEEQNRIGGHAFQGSFLPREHSQGFRSAPFVAKAFPEIHLSGKIGVAKRRDASHCRSR